MKGGAPLCEVNKLKAAEAEEWMRQAQAQVAAQERLWACLVARIEGIHAALLLELDRKRAAEVERHRAELAGLRADHARHMASLAAALAASEDAQLAALAADVAEAAAAAQHCAAHAAAPPAAAAAPQEQQRSSFQRSPPEKGQLAEKEKEREQQPPVSSSKKLGESLDGEQVVAPSRSSSACGASPSAGGPAKEGAAAPAGGSRATASPRPAGPGGTAPGGVTANGVAPPPSGGTTSPHCGVTGRKKLPGTPPQPQPQPQRQPEPESEAEPGPAGRASKLALRQVLEPLPSVSGRSKASARLPNLELGAGLGPGLGPHDARRGDFGARAQQQPPRDADKLRAEMRLKSPYDALALRSYSRECWEAAAGGSADHQCLRGWCCMLGLGVPLDREIAQHWFREAARQGHGPAGVLRAWAADTRGHQAAYQPLVAWLERRAAAGDATCETWLAWGHLYHKIRPHLDGLALLSAAAGKPGGAWARYLLGWCHLFGVHGAEQSQGRSFQLYLQAAREGFAAAQSAVGFCYHNGAGVGKDRVEARVWYHLAARQGLADAQYFLAKMLFRELMEVEGRRGGGETMGGVKIGGEKKAAGEATRVSLRALSWSSPAALEILSLWEKAAAQGEPFALMELKKEKLLAEAEELTRRSHGRRRELRGKRDDGGDDGRAGRVESPPATESAAGEFRQQERSNTM
eukprot:jgi/Mesen1/6278/ME000324S05319